MKKSCTQCSAPFEITTDDLAFYEKVSPEFGGKKYLIPPPTLCQDCRLQRRLTFRNERKLYHRKCDLTGKQIISVYAPEKPFTVYEQSAWWSDSWDPFAYGQEIDLHRSFFEQFRMLSRKVPIPHIHMESCENTDYANFCWGTKNSYLVFGTDRSRDCSYSNLLIDCENCIDCSCSKQCTFCYQLIDCTQCYRSMYSKDCVNCDEVNFSIDCKQCKHCFGCTGLRQKEYHMFNTPVSKSEYQEKLSALVLNEQAINHAHAMAQKHWANHPRLFSNLLQCEECTGDNLLQCKRCTDCFEGMQAVDCVRCQNIPMQASDCRDVYSVGYGSENCYESYCIAAKNTLFSYLIYPSGNKVMYSSFCNACNDVFGCIGLRHKQYCILNKQYSKEEYEILVPKIIEKMRTDSEWGEFFPVNLSAFLYNETLAQEYVPLSKQEVLSRGWEWQDEEESKDQYLGPVYTIPDSIRETTDDITKQILQCSVTGKPFKIIPQELKFYREMNLPIPRKSPDQRHKERMALRNPRKLWTRACAKCSEKIETTYSPERPETVYCEQCYLSTVY